MPHSQIEQNVLEMIEQSPVGAVPRTPVYQDALTHLYAAHEVYASADHKDGHVTVRSLAKLPHFQAQNLDALIAGKIVPEALEPNGTIFDRYVNALPETRRLKAESFRLTVAGRPAHHRAKQVGDAKVVAHDPVHTLFLVPGAGPHPGLPGNYLYGFLVQAGTDANGPWLLQVHDSDDGAAGFDGVPLKDALAKLVEVMESAPFTLAELEYLGFRIK